MAYDEIRTRAPKPPVDVQLVYRDGMTVPVDCLYIGWDEQRSYHVWRIISPRNEMPINTKIAELPSRCALEIVLAVDDDDGEVDDLTEH